MIKRFIKWIFPEWEYKATKITGLRPTAFIKNYCKTFNSVYVDEHFVNSLKGEECYSEVIYKIKIKDWFE